MTRSSTRVLIPAPEPEVWPDVVDVRDCDGALAYRVSADRGRTMVRAGLAEPVGNRTIKYLRTSLPARGRAQRLPLAEANFTVQRRHGIDHAHILRRCAAYRADVREAIR